MTKSRAASLILSLALMLAAACAAPEEVVDDESSEEPVPSAVEEAEDGTILGVMMDGEEVDLDLPEGAVAALGRRRACVYEGKNKTGRASCWYAPVTSGCRSIPHITSADYCGAAGCVRDNAVSSLWINADTRAGTLRLYSLASLRGTAFWFTVVRGNGFTNLSTGTSVKDNQPSSLQLCTSG